jgi:hypothetical protein
MAYTVTYLWPIAGLVAPTATQVQGHNQVSADVNKGASGDTTVTITHNFGTSVADLASGFPDIQLEPTALAYYTALPFISSRTTNTVVVTCATGGGTTGDIFRIRIKKPFSKEK